MIYTVSDFYNTYKPELQLMAGNGGLSRQVTKAGILDYELEPALKNKYFYTNFQEKQLALTTLLYAKDNPFLIADGVKHLAAKGCSGLVIKNVFRLPIHESVLRYADSKNFPVFLIKSTNVYFEDVIYTLNRRIEELASCSTICRELDSLLKMPSNPQEQLLYGRKLNPSFEHQHMAIFAPFDEFFSEMQFAAYEARYRKSNLNMPSNLLTLYKNGVLFLYSQTEDTEIEPDAVAEVFSDEILKEGSPLAVGISKIHHYLGELKQTIIEGIQTAFCAAEDKKRILFYGELGILQVLLPFAEKREMQLFSHSIMDKLEEYDAEAKGHLIETLNAYCQADYNIQNTAKKLCQHENTVRYRLERVSDITGLSFKFPSQAEQLAVACKIAWCRKVLKKSRLTDYESDGQD